MISLWDSQDKHNQIRQHLPEPPEAVLGEMNYALAYS